MTFGCDRIACALGAALLFSTLATAGCSKRGAEPAAEAESAPAESGATGPSDPSAPTDLEAQAERNREILQRKIDSGPVIGAAPEPPGRIAEAAIEEFHAAQQAILGTDLVLGISHLEQAVKLDPELGEAWFQLGEARHLLALIRVSNDADAEGLALERAAVDALREARRLLDRASVRTLDAFDLEAMRKETADRLAELDPVSPDDRVALARLRDLANEMASELPVLDEDGEGGEEEGEGEAPPAEPTVATSAATA